MIATIKDKTRKITLSEFGEVKIKLANQKGKNHIKRKNALTIKLGLTRKRATFAFTYSEQMSPFFVSNQKER